MAFGAIVPVNGAMELKYFFIAGKLMQTAYLLLPIALAYYVSYLVLHPDKSFCPGKNCKNIRYFGQKSCGLKSFRADSHIFDGKARLHCGSQEFHFLC